MQFSAVSAVNYFYQVILLEINVEQFGRYSRPARPTRQVPGLLTLLYRKTVSKKQTKLYPPGQKDLLKYYFSDGFSVTLLAFLGGFTHYLDFLHLLKK